MLAYIPSASKIPLQKWEKPRKIRARNNTKKPGLWIGKPFKNKWDSQSDRIMIDLSIAIFELLCICSFTNRPSSKMRLYSIYVNSNFMISKNTCLFWWSCQRFPQPYHWRPNVSHSPTWMMVMAIRRTMWSGHAPVESSAGGNLSASNATETTKEINGWIPPKSPQLWPN